MIASLQSSMQTDSVNGELTLEEQMKNKQVILSGWQSLLIKAGTFILLALRLQLPELLLPEHIRQSMAEGIMMLFLKSSTRLVTGSGELIMAERWKTG